MKKWCLSLLLSFLALSGFSEDKPAYFFFSPTMVNSHLKGYSDEEKVLIEKDLRVVRSVCFGEGHERQTNPIYLATAGAPGSWKTTILERFLKDHSEYTDYVYLDPDQRGLKFMVHTYYSRSLNSLITAQCMDYSLVVEGAYNKWRAGSNYITLSLLEEAFHGRYNIVYGTTSTGDYIPSFYDVLKKANYRIVLFLCSCEDSLRRKTISFRNYEQRFCQVSPEDMVSKAKLFVLRMPIYFSCADVLYLYWTDDLFNKEHLAAILSKGCLKVKDEKALQDFIQKYETDRKILMQQEGKKPGKLQEIFIVFR